MSPGCETSLPMPPVHVSIRPGRAGVELLVSDQGGGIRQSMLENIWEYGSSGSPKGKADRLRLQMSGHGIGMPLSRHYARFFGGDLRFSSKYGTGTVVSIRINHLSSGARDKTEFCSAGLAGEEMAASEAVKQCQS